MTWKHLLWPGVAVLALAWSAGQPRAQSQDQSPGTQSSQAAAQSTPASEQAAPAQPGNAPSSLQPADFQNLLYKIYTANYRVGDLTGSLPIDQWKLTDTDQASLHQKADALRSSVASVEKSRNEFLSHPGDGALGQAMTAALQALLPQIDDFSKALENTPGANYAKDYQQAGSDLRGLDQQIEPYVASLQPKSEAQAQAAAAPPEQNPAPNQPAGQAPAPEQTENAQAEKAQTPPAAPANPSQSEANASQAPPPSTQPAQAQAPAPAPAEAAQHPEVTGQVTPKAEQAPSEQPAEKAQTTPPAPPNPPPSVTNQASTPPAEAPQPQAATPAEAAAKPSVAPAAMPKADVQALLYKVYAANFRVGDLTGSLGIDQWKNVSDQDRSALSQKADTLRTAVAGLEKVRNDFYNNPEDLAQGQATESAIQSLLPKIDEFAAALTNTPGANNAKDYQRSAADLRSLDAKLEPYVAYLEAKSQPPPAPAAAPGVPGVETEVIKPFVAPTPLTVVPPEKPPMANDQLKTLLYQAYVPAFRIKDLLSQEQPEHWKISNAERTVFTDASQALTKRLADLTKWREQLDSHPDSLEAAFEVYAALDKVDEPAGIVGHMVGQYEDPKIGAEYVEKAKQVAEFRNQVEPYVSYLLRRHDEAVGTVERNFVTCETELTSVMRPTTVAAEPMRNVLPVFRGRGRSVTRGTPSSKAAARSSKKKAPAKPASTKPAAAKSSSGH